MKTREFTSSPLQMFIEESPKYSEARGGGDWARGGAHSVAFHLAEEDEGVEEGPVHFAGHKRRAAHVDAPAGVPRPSETVTPPATTT
jgi:hypothetical protein